MFNTLLYGRKKGNSNTLVRVQWPSRYTFTLTHTHTPKSAYRGALPRSARPPSAMSPAQELSARHEWKKEPRKRKKRSFSPLLQRRNQRMREGREGRRIVWCDAMRSTDGGHAALCAAASQHAWGPRHDQMKGCDKPELWRCEVSESWW